MSSIAKSLFDNLKIGNDGQITRTDSPKITQEPKSKDFDTSSIRSPMFGRKSGGGSAHGKSGMIEGLSPVAAERAFNMRYAIKNDNFARGSYGKVELAFDKMNNEKVVIKRIPKSTPIKMIQAEVRAGQQLGQHATIANFHKYYDFGDHHALVFQFIEGQDLFSYLEETGFEPKNEAHVRSLLLDILRALQHVHSKDIAHRDIKLENILMTKDKKAYLIDFGLCATVEDGKLLREWCGSDNYLAPQIVRRTPYDGYQADVFSLGVVLFALLFGVFPFESLRVNSRHSNDPSCPLPRLRVRFPMDVKVSREAKELLISMLEDEQDRRITVDEIFNHPWVTQSEETILVKESN